MGVTSSYTLLLKPNESILTEKHYWSQIISKGEYISIRTDKHKRTSPQNGAVNT